MILFNNKLEMLNTIMIIIIIVFLLTCFITNYFKSIENFSQSQYGLVACPPQFTKVGDTNNMYYNSGNVGINNDNPTANLHVTGYSLTEGVLGVSGGTLYAKDNNHLQAGSLVIGSISKNYGGGNNWNSNTAGLMLECGDNTEIVVHDSGTRLASLMYYQGAGHNTIHIGRNMAWGVTHTQIHGDLFVHGYTNGMKIAQKWSVWIGAGAANDWQFWPNVHNQKCVKIKFHFYGQYYSLIGVNTPASGPVTLRWENDKAINGYWLPYPYTHQGPNQGPKFWFMRMANIPKRLMRIIVVYYNHTDPYDDLLYGDACTT